MIKTKQYICPKCGLFVSITINIRNTGKDGEKEIYISEPKCISCNSQLDKTEVEPRF